MRKTAERELEMVLSFGVLECNGFEVADKEVVAAELGRGGGVGELAVLKEG